MSVPFLKNPKRLVISNPRKKGAKVAARKKTKKGQVRKTARRAYTPAQAKYFARSPSSRPRRGQGTTHRSMQRSAAVHPSFPKFGFRPTRTTGTPAGATTSPVSARRSTSRVCSKNSSLRTGCSGHGGASTSYGAPSTRPSFIT